MAFPQTVTVPCTLLIHRNTGETHMNLRKAHVWSPNRKHWSSLGNPSQNTRKTHNFVDFLSRKTIQTPWKSYVKLFLKILENPWPSLPCQDIALPQPTKKLNQGSAHSGKFSSPEKGACPKILSQNETFWPFSVIIVLGLKYGKPPFSNHGTASDLRDALL